MDFPEQSQTVQICEKTVFGLKQLHWYSQRCCLFHSLFLEIQVGVQIDVVCLQGFMIEPQYDCCLIDTPLKQCHGAAVPLMSCKT